jgi:two-component system phosphate regulon sensor histidine kinase PhoR
MMEELVFNLCDNAIRYNVHGGSVNVEVRPVKERVLLAVQDTGIGISRENQERVFERFYRVDKSRSKATGGTGLGLAIVKHIAAIHGAEIGMESEPGTGTTITLSFDRSGGQDKKAGRDATV